MEAEEGRKIIFISSIRKLTQHTVNRHTEKKRENIEGESRRKKRGEVKCDSNGKYLLSRFPIQSNKISDFIYSLIHHAYCVCGWHSAEELCQMFSKNLIMRIFNLRFPRNFSSNLIRMNVSCRVFLS